MANRFRGVSNGILARLGGFGGHGNGGAPGAIIEGNLSTFSVSYAILNVMNVHSLL